MAKDAERVKRAISEKCTDQQITAWRYFCNTEEDSCLTKWNHVSDGEYDAMVNKMLRKLGLDTPKRALAKFGVDESEVSEFQPICLQDYIPYIKTAENYSRQGEDKKYRTSNYQVTWLLCSKDEVYAYQSTFSLLEDDKKEIAEEYFFRDITNFTTVDVEDEITLHENNDKQEQLIKRRIDKTKFRISVPGDKFECAMTPTPEVEENIKRLKTLLRQKKTQN